MEHARMLCLGNLLSVRTLPAQIVSCSEYEDVVTRSKGKPHKSVMQVLTLTV